MVYKYTQRISFVTGTANTSYAGRLWGVCCNS